MDLWSLRVLDTVVSVGTISGAAAIVRRTQPQVSRIIKNLEAELGFALFVRQGRRLSPTPNCATILQHGRAILDGFSAMDNLARSLRTQVQPGLHVIGPPYAFHGLMPLIVAQLRKEMPEVPLTVTGLHRDENGRWIMPSSFDVGIAVLPFDQPGMVQQPIGPLGVGVIMPADHPLKDRPELTARDFGDYPFVALRQAAPLRRRMDRLFEAAEVRPNIAITVPDSTSALRMVMEGVGIAVGDPLSARVIGGDKVRYVPFRGMQESPLGLFWPAGSPQHPARARFSELARQLVTSGAQLTRSG